MLELVRFDQSSRAIMFENQSVAPSHILAGGILRQIKSIFDQFKNDVVARQRENAHHHSASSFGHDETIARPAKVGDEIAVEFRFTVPMKTDGVVKIDQTFARHQLLKITHQPIGTFNRNPKIRAGKRKQNREIDISMEQRIEADAALIFVTKAKRDGQGRSEEHTSELQSHSDLVCR